MSALPHGSFQAQPEGPHLPTPQGLYARRGQRDTTTTAATTAAAPAETAAEAAATATKAEAHEHMCGREERHPGGPETHPRPPGASARPEESPSGSGGPLRPEGVSSVPADGCEARPDGHLLPAHAAPGALQGDGSGGGPAIGGPRRDGRPQAPERGQADHVSTEAEDGPDRRGTIFSARQFRGVTETYVCFGPRAQN